MTRTSTCTNGKAHSPRREEVRFNSTSYLPRPELLHSKDEGTNRLKKTGLQLSVLGSWFSLVLSVNQHIQGAVGTCGTNAIGVNADLATGNIVYTGHLRVRRQYDGIELRHQLFALAEG